MMEAAVFHDEGFLCVGAGLCLSLLWSDDIHLYSNTQNSNNVQWVLFPASFETSVNHNFNAFPLFLFLS